MQKPIKGPIKTLAKDDIKDFLKEKTFNFVNATPRDINIKNIVAYINKKDVFSTKIGSSIR